MTSIDGTLANNELLKKNSLVTTSPVSIPNSSSSSRKSSTSAIINPFNDLSLTPEKNKPLSLTFLHKKRRNSDPILDTNEQTSPLTSEIRLIRKKSGELVKSSLKLNQLGNTSKSMPNTPIFKNVHFGQAVDVRYFNETEKPSAVSASSSPTLKAKKFGSGAVFHFDRYDNDGDDEDSESDEDESNNNWDLEIVNFEKIKYNEKFQSKSLIFLESLSLNVDRNSIIGIIAVKNRSYEKTIHLRYTFDNWKTVIEIECKFENDLKSIPRILKRNNYDRFKFNLELKSFRFLVKEEPTKINLKFCIRYSFENQEIWDNNSNKNYEINLIYEKRKLNDRFSLNDLEDEIYMKSTTESNPQNDYFSYKKNNHYNFKNDDFSLSSPDTPKILKDDYKKIIEPDEEISLDPILKDLNSFTEKPIVFGKPVNNNENVDPVDTSLKNLPKMNSKSYQELIDSYCFFKGTDADSDFIQSDLNPNIDFVTTMFKPNFKFENNLSTNIDDKKSPSTISSYLNNDK